ncbi:hypothetical protein Zmor_018866 [Zophobas morio]|uniref:Acyltransferase 3 domain-containing protein n=2 Tax=Zophobas morio TaxID=2755281 RepID=A0AA38ME25_9CUCU|nr:hypothetical protein Zmor_018866 [Zophobas morio]
MPQLFKFDDFYQCLYRQEDTSYCLVSIKLNPENPANTTKVWNVIKDVSSNTDNYRHDLLRHGLCLPNHCEHCSANFSQRVEQIYDEKFKNLGLVTTVDKIRCETKNSDYVVGKLDYILAILAASGFVFVVTLSFALELFKYQSSEKYDTFSKTGVGHILTCFSVSQNWKILTKINPKDYKSDFVPSMQGVRFICSVWIIYVHTAIVTLAIPLANPEYTEEAVHRVLTSYHSNGGVLVQIFFVLSSWLLVVSILEKLQKSKKITFGYLLVYIFGKYFRLIPLLALVVGLHSTWLVHYSRGPFWDDLVGEEYRICRQKWWLNLLFINNFFTSDGLCLIQSWYMAAEFQLFVLGSIILWLIQSKPRRILIICGAINLIFIVGLFCYLFWRNLEVGFKFTPEAMYNLSLSSNYEWNFSWTSTIMSVPGFAVGMCFGYVFWKYKEEKIFTKKSHILTVWILCLALVPLSVFTYTFYVYSGYYSNSRWFASIYGSVYKTIFSCGIGLMLFGMSQGLGGFLKKVFEYPLFHVMAQLSYGAFVVHFSIARVNAGLKMYPPLMADYVMFGDIIVTVSLSYLVSLFLTIFVQMPFTIMSKKMMFMLK